MVVLEVMMMLMMNIKKIQDFKQKLTDENILDINAVGKFDNVVDKWKQTKDKEIVYKNVDT